ncbi:hypothetical protein AB0A05_27140 [Streptomyces sp. NPDC046374]|uniref:hypothetical protein n=1 Tax=Streptomyces sp. NPDC046374 TaxID=3154917 RepID=UPI0033E3D775
MRKTPRPSRLMAELTADVERILDGDDSGVPPVIRLSAELAASGSIKFSLSLVPGLDDALHATLSVDPDDEDRLRRALPDLTKSGYRKDGRLCFDLSDEEMAALAENVDLDYDEEPAP